MNTLFMVLIIILFIICTVFAVVIKILLDGLCATIKILKLHLAEDHGIILK